MTGYQPGPRSPGNQEEPVERAVREVFRRQADRLTVPTAPDRTVSHAQVLSIASSNPSPVAAGNGGRFPDQLRGPRRLALAAAAVAMVAGTGLGLLASEGQTESDRVSVTDSAQEGPSSEDSGGSEGAEGTEGAEGSGGAEDSGGSEGAENAEGSEGSEDAEISEGSVLVAQDPNTWLLADPDRWLMVSHRLVQEPIETPDPGSSVHVYELDGGEFLILAVLPSPSKEDSRTIETTITPTSDPETGRTSATWNHGGHRLTLVGFNIDEQQFVGFAQSLDPQLSSWEVSGATLRRSVEASPVSDSVPPPNGPVIEVEYVPLDQDGRPVLNGRIIQRTRQASPIDLYNRLTGDGGIGTLEIRSVAGGEGAQVTGFGIEFGVRYADGWLTTWDSQSAEPIVAEFLDDVALADEDRWQAAVQASDTAQSDAISDAMAAEDAGLTALSNPALARLALPEPYELVSVRDPSQWSESDRSRHEAEAVAERAQLQHVTVWAQSFRRVGNEASVLPDVMVEVHDVRVRFPTSAGVEDQPFNFGGFDGFYGPHSQGTAGLTMERGDLRIQLFSPTLSPDELADFVRNAGLQTDGARGLATLTGFSLSAEGSLAFEDQAGWPTWESEWRRTDDGEPVYVSFHRQPSELADLMIDLHATWQAYPGEPMGRPVDGERLLFVDSGSMPQVIWARPDLGGLISILGPGAVEAALALDEIGDDHWSALVAPVLEAPQVGPGN